MEAILREAQRAGRERPRRAARARTVEDLVRVTAELAGLSREDLCSATRRLAVMDARRALATVAVNELGRPGATVARVLGVATSTVNRQAAIREQSDLAKRLLAVLGQAR